VDNNPEDMCRTLPSRWGKLLREVVGLQQAVVSSCLRGIINVKVVELWFPRPFTKTAGLTPFRVFGAVQTEEIPIRLKIEIYGIW